MPDDSTLHLIAELDANCAVMGAYYCGECLQCMASNQIRRLLEENSILRQAVGQEGRANRMTELYQKANQELEQLRKLIQNYIKAEQDLQHATNDHFAVNYDEEIYEAHQNWKASWRALEKEANLEH